MDIRLTVDTQLADALRAVPSSLKKHIRPKLQRAAGIVARSMKRDVAKAHSTLTNSIRAELTGPLSARAVAGVQYGAFVEEGSGPGGLVPKQSLMDWMKVVGIASGDEQEDARTLFLIRRKIFFDGTPAQPFAEPARDKNEQQVKDLIDSGVRAALAEAGLQ